MRQIQLYKVLISIILFSLAFSKHVKPNGKKSYINYQVYLIIQQVITSLMIMDYHIVTLKSM